MANVKVVLRPSKANSNGEVPLYIRITHHRKAKFVALGVRVHPKKHWNASAQKVKRSFPNSGRVNKYIATKLAEAEDHAFKLATKPDQYSSQTIKEEIMGKPPACFITYGRKVAKLYEASDQVRSAERYTGTLNKLKRYLGKRAFTFDDLTVSFLHEYEAHLKSIGNHVNTVHTNLKTIRAILYRGIKEDLHPQAKNPFFKFKLKTAPTNRERLTFIEMNRIADLELDESKLIFHARNVFVFSFYCAGIRISDLLRLRWLNIQDEYLSYKMGKTGSHRKLRLIDQAQEILRIYKKDNADLKDFIFPFITAKDAELEHKKFMKRLAANTTIINDRLKQIGKLAKVPKKLTTHIARHSFADIARKKGVNVYDISKSLGHTNIAITQAYLAAFDDNSLQNAMEKIFSD